MKKTQMLSNWKHPILKNVLKMVKGKKPKELGEKSEQLDIPYINIKAFEKNIITRYTDGSDARLCDIDDILIVWDGARSGLVGRGAKGAVGSTLGKLVNDGLENDYLYFFLQSQYGYINSNPRGIGIPHVDPNIFWNIVIPFPPLPEQERIVAKIEELFIQLDAGVAELTQAKAQLKRYRQSVLKSAVEGELTREWRELQMGEIEPASQLLERILAERREKWEDGRKTVDGGRKKKKYKEPVAPDVDGLPELPDGWVWATLPQLGELNRGKSKHRPRNAPHLYGGAYPFVQTGDIRHAKGIIRKYTQTYSEEGLAQSRLWSAGTLCITLAANIADTAILGLDACFPDSVAGFFPDSNHCNIQYIEYFLRTAKTDLERYAPATAQKNINIKILSELAVPLPSLEEQEIFVNKVERRLSVADEIEKELDEALVRSGRLRQAVLKSAFEGRLV